MEPGTQSVLMAGTPLERKLELYAVLLATAAYILVRNYLVYSIITITHDFLLLTKFSNNRLWSRDKSHIETKQGLRHCQWHTDE